MFMMSPSKWLPDRPTNLNPRGFFETGCFVGDNFIGIAGTYCGAT